MAKQKEEPKQWDLTKEELKKLKGFQARQEATDRILKVLLRKVTADCESEDAWWDAIVLNHKIPDELKGKLIASPQLGKFWVKDQVPELDKTLKFHNRTLL